MRKIRIDKEIENLKNELETLNDTSQNYISPELREIQGLVLTTHAQFEVTLESRIIMEIFRNQTKRTPPEIVFRLLEHISFLGKLNIVKNFNDGIPFELLSKVNKYRNEFAHPRGMLLEKKYNYNTDNGKLIIRDLLRCMAESKRKLNEYCKKFL